METNKAKARGGNRPALNSASDHINTRRAIYSPQAGKWLAMIRYNAGVTSLAQTDAAFARHPDWVSA